MTIRTGTGVIAAALAFAAVTMPLSAQGSGGDVVRGSRYIATTDWMTDAISRLRDRGYLGSLDPLSQPWTRDEVARAVDRVPASSLDSMPRHVADWFRLLRSELGPELLRIQGRDSVRLGAVAWGGVTAATSPRIDPLFPLRAGQPTLNGKPRDARGFWPFGGGEAWAEQGPVALDLRLGWDLSLRRADPDGRFPARSFDALPDNEMTYASARFNGGGLVVGRLRRNWAPVGSTGLMLSDNAIGIPQIGFDIGGGNLVVRGFVGELDTLLSMQRWIVAHRLEYVRPDFAISIGESKVYGARSGPLLSNLNPVEIFFLTGDRVSGEVASNTALDGQFWLRRDRLTLGGETFVDDVWVIHHAPARGALNAFARYATSSGWGDLGLEYRAVLSYTYWSVHDDDRVMFYGRGIGDNFSDYDRWKLYADVYPSITGLRLTPTLARQRKGEWDFRRAGIADSVWKASTAFLQGTPETITRFALAGRYQPTRRAFAEWDAGVNVVSNANHVRGHNVSEFGAMVKIGVQWTTPDRRAP